MEITASAVKDLREKTGAGMMDCKKALSETAGDFEKAVEYLRKKGMASAAKKAGRATKDGTIHSITSSDGKASVLLEINCETDFVAKTEQFKSFVDGIAQHIAIANPADVPALLQQKYFADSSKTVEDKLREAIATLGENMVITRFARYPNTGDSESVSYIHAGGKVGVLVEFACGGKAKDPKFQEFGRNVAMHIAAAMPQFQEPKDVPQATLAKEKEIFIEQMKNSGKPANLLEKIAEGKINKYYEENCLVKQAYVKDPSLTVEKYAAQVSKDLGAPIAIKRFTRYSLGETAKAEAETTN
jgi:elongation factor Ts